MIRELSIYIKTIVFIDIICKKMPNKLYKA